MLVTSFLLPFAKPIKEKKNIILATFMLFLANDFNVVQSKILCFGKGLTLCIVQIQSICSCQIIYCSKKMNFIHNFEESIMGEKEKMLVTGIDPFPNNPLYLCVCSTSLLKTMWENFSFTHSFSTHFENFLPFSSNLKMSSVNPFSF